MKPLPTIDALRERFAYDRESGALTTKRASGKIPVGGQIGYVAGIGYLYVHWADGHRLLVHRVAWAIETGAWPTGQIDHMDGCKTNNRFSNMRDVPPRVNSENRRKALCTSKTKILGVSPNKGKFRAQISVGNKARYIGVFDTQGEAYNAYLRVKRVLHAGCTI